MADVHAGVFIAEGDREGLERLCRYGARPPFSLERLSIVADGRIAYLLRKPRKNGATHLVMTPEHGAVSGSNFVAHSPPRYPLVRFAGVLAPASSFRRDVVAMRLPASPWITNPVEHRRNTVARARGRPRVCAARACVWTA